MANTETCRLGVWQGEGIGPEIVAPTVQAVELALQVSGEAVPEFVPLLLGREAIDATGRVVPEETWETITGLDGWILGPHDNVSYPPSVAGQLNPSAHLRKQADLWANIRPVRGVPGAVHPDLDVVIVRENTEGMYADRNMLVGSGDVTVNGEVSLAIGVFTQTKIRRIVRRAAAIAAARDGVLTVAHKSNVLTETSGRYVAEAKACVEEFGVEVQPVHIDALCAELVTRPERYATIVAENMFGDILSDLAGGLGGSLGIAGSINASESQVMAQAAHGSAPDIAGQGIANPAGIMNSAAQMLDSLGYPQAAELLEGAVREAVIKAPTADLLREAAAADPETATPVTDEPAVASEAQGARRPATTEEFAKQVFVQLKPLV
ncbi:isocitrate/isopropylmalate family dehydrogenase [Corynebacterium sp. HMSC27B11]|uniref:isocitrate/isopropylmalate family dehydrogenase n=1 Tax=Corynebacterium sp. HMSC27B11 TaxID=1581065 RepID=UPI0008A4F2DE|nr:isocitrate/isopropylmalate family dehydrogenase [Corynebacterium sp. HMSC27B11]OFS16538.1 dehydrogenase [Corynebacterium sp. HMSC27B11]